MKIEENKRRFLRHLLYHQYTQSKGTKRTGVTGV